MIARLLPFNEWCRLGETEARDVWPRLDPAMTKVIVIEDGDTIIASQLIVPVWHVECLWIHPDHRKKTGALRRLWRAVTDTLKASGISAVATSACSDDVRRLLNHVHAEKLAGDHFLVRM